MYWSESNCRRMPWKVPIAFICIMNILIGNWSKICSLRPCPGRREHWPQNSHVDPMHFGWLWKYAQRQCQRHVRLLCVHSTAHIHKALLIQGHLGSYYLQCTVSRTTLGLCCPATRQGKGGKSIIIIQSFSNKEYIRHKHCIPHNAPTPSSP